MAYIGVSPSNGVRRKHTYTATANQTSFSGAGAEGATLSYNDSNFVDVYQNGVKLSEADYTSTSGTAIVLATGATVSDMVEIVVYDVFSVADTVSKADGGTFDGDVTFAEGIKIDADNGDSPQILFENSDSVTTDGAISTFDDNTGTMVVVGSNFYINSSGSETRFNTSEESSAVMLNRNGDINLITGGTGATGTTRLKITSDGSISTPTLGTSNVRIGENAGISIASGGNYNTVIGKDAGTALTTGDGVVAIGFEALKTEDANGTTTAIGYQALKVQNAGAESNNTAVGYQAGLATNTGVSNTLIGAAAGDNITSGSSNIIIGQGVDAPSATADKQINIGNFIHNEVSASNAFGNLDVTMNSTTENVLAISQNTAVGLFSGGNSFSGVVIINDINQSGEAGVFISAGGTFKLISQVSSHFVNSSSPNTAQTGYYITNGVMFIKPGRSGTTNYRILSLRTRTTA